MWIVYDLSVDRVLPYVVKVGVRPDLVDLFQVGLKNLSLLIVCHCHSWLSVECSGVQDCWLTGIVFVPFHCTQGSPHFLHIMWSQLVGVFSPVFPFFLLYLGSNLPLDHVPQMGEVRISGAHQLSSGFSLLSD